MMTRQHIHDSTRLTSLQLKSPEKRYSTEEAAILDHGAAMLDNCPGKGYEH